MGRVSFVYEKVNVVRDARGRPSSQNCTCVVDESLMVVNPSFFWAEAF